MEPLLLLHGAIGSSAQMMPVAELLRLNYKVYTLNFAGHGGSQLPDAPLSIELFASEVLRFMNAEGLNKISIFGYSMGGYVGMYLAKNHPDKINRLITLATKYKWDEAVAANEVKKLNPEKTELKVPAFAESLSRLHAPADWKMLMLKTADMMTELGRNNPLKPTDYAELNLPVLLMLGDRDKMVTMEETVAVYQSLPHARLAILPGTSHPIEQADAETVAYLVRKFF